MSLIFISHSSIDNAQAIALKNWLIDNGWDDLFLDLDPHHGISAGERWKDALIQASSYCDAVILMLSDNWLSSHYCMEEYRMAKELNKQIFPLIIDDSLTKEIPQDIIDNWQYINLILGHRFFTQQVKLPDGSQQEVSFAQSGLTALKNGLTKAGLNPESFAWPPIDQYDNPPSPYKGLRPLDATDAGIFFGRDGAIFDLMSQLRGLRNSAPPRFMVILGASGAGKSSFIRAGILPRLARDELHFIVMPIIRPETAVISGNKGFLSALTQLSEQTNLSHTRKSLSLAIEGGKTTLLPILKQIINANTLSLEQADTIKLPPTLVLTIDQAEELFQIKDNTETESFLTLLADLVKDNEANLMVISTIRSDSYDSLQSAQALKDITQQLFSLPPMAKGAYKQIIENPARLLEKTSKPLQIDPLLTEKLLSDLEQGGNKDSLPLLAFTLERLYKDYGSDGDLLLKEYLTFEEQVDNQTVLSGLGGIQGAVTIAVQEAIKKAQQDPRIPNDEVSCLALLRRGFIPWLAGIDPETGKAKRKVARYDEIPDEAKPIIDSLVENRLLTKDYDEQQQTITIEPAHESILRQWQQLDKWLGEDSHDLSLADIIKSEATAWEANERDNEWLRIKGGRLQEAERLINEEKFADYITNSQKAYLQACRTQENEELESEKAQIKALNEAQQQAIEKQQQVIKRTRLGLGISFVLLLLSGGLTNWALENKNEAEKQATLAKEKEKEATEQTKIAKENEQKAKENEEKINEKIELLVKNNINIYGIYSDLSDLSKTNSTKNAVEKEEALKEIISKFEKILGKDKFIPIYKVQEDNTLVYKNNKFKLYTDLRKLTKLKYFIPQLINLILETESMDNDERQYWFNLLPTMTDDQIMKLYVILAVEEVKLGDLEEKYKDEIKELNDKHLIEWLEEFKQKYQNKEVSITDAKDYYEAVVGLFNSKKLDKAEMLKKLINIKDKLDVNSITNTKEFEIYETLFQLIIDNSNKEQKLALYKQQLMTAKLLNNTGIISNKKVARSVLAVTWYSLFTGKQSDLQSAITLSEEGKKLAPDYLPLDTNYAHALALLGKEQQALSIYKKYLGKILYNSDGTKGGIWEEMVLQDFKDLEKEGITSPTFDKAKKLIKNYQATHKDTEKTDKKLTNE